MTSEAPRWYKSSYSDNGGACLEAADNFAATHGIVPIRDSKNPTGPQLAFPTAAFALFVASVKSRAAGIA